MQSGNAKSPKRCSICGDNALSCNFGAITCESCKAFFRRNAHKEELLDECQNDCTMTRETRSFCKSCRLQKCFAMGMNKGLIWTDEDKQKRKRIIEENRYRKKTGDDSDSQIEKLDKLADLNSFQGAFISSLKKGTKSRLKFGKNIKSSSISNDFNDLSTSGASGNNTPNSLSPAGFSEYINQRDDDDVKSIIDTADRHSNTMESLGNELNQPVNATDIMETCSVDKEKSPVADLNAQKREYVSSSTYFSNSDNVKDQRLPTIDTIMKPTTPPKELEPNSSFSSYEENELSNEMLAHLTGTLPHHTEHPLATDQSLKDTSSMVIDVSRTNDERLYEINRFHNLHTPHEDVLRQEYGRKQNSLHSFHVHDQPICNSNSASGMMLHNPPGITHDVTRNTDPVGTNINMHENNFISNNAYNAMPHIMHPAASYAAQFGHVQSHEQHTYQNNQAVQNVNLSTNSNFAQDNEIGFIPSVSDGRCNYNESTNISAHGATNLTLNNQNTNHAMCGTNSNLVEDHNIGFIPSRSDVKSSYNDNTNINGQGNCTTGTNSNLVEDHNIRFIPSRSDVKSSYNDNTNINGQDNCTTAAALNNHTLNTQTNHNSQPAEDPSSDVTSIHSALYSQSVPEHVLKQIDWTLHKPLVELMYACELSYDKAIVQTIKKEPDISESFNQMEGFIKKSVVFAKNLHGFSSLPQSDQVALVKGSFIELMCVLFFKIFNPDRRSFYVRHRLPENPEIIVTTETKVGSALGVVAEGHKLMEGYVILWKQFNKYARNDPAIFMLMMAHILFMKREHFTYRNVEHISYYCDLYCNILKNYIKAAYPKGEVKFVDIIAMVPKIIKNCSFTQNILDKASLENLSVFTMNIFDK